MCQVSSGELGLVDPLADPSVDLIEGALERGVDGAEIGKCGGQARAQDAVIDAGEEQRSPESEVGDGSFWAGVRSSRGGAGQPVDDDRNPIAGVIDEQP